MCQQTLRQRRRLREHRAKVSMPTTDQNPMTPEQKQAQSDRWIARGYLLALTLGLVIAYLHGGIH
jgi:hypothetical protein